MGLNGCEEKVELFSSLLAPIKSPRIAEVGVLHGDTSLALVEKLVSLTVLAVDPYPANWNAEGFLSGEDLYNQVHAKAAPFRDRYQLIRQTSINASQWIGNGTLDLVFIDGAHSCDACVVDVQNWVPKLRKGGVMVLHDFSHVYPGVVCCVREVLDKFADGPVHAGMD